MRVQLNFFVPYSGLHSLQAPWQYSDSNAWVARVTDIKLIVMMLHPMVLDDLIQQLHGENKRREYRDLQHTTKDPAVDWIFCFYKRQPGTSARLHHPTLNCAGNPIPWLMVLKAKRSRTARMDALPPFCSHKRSLIGATNAVSVP